MNGTSAASLSARALAAQLQHCIEPQTSILRANLSYLQDQLRTVDSSSGTDADELGAAIEESINAVQRLSILCRELRLLQPPDEQTTTSRFELGTFVQSIKPLLTAEAGSGARIRIDSAYNPEISAPRDFFGQLLLHLIYAVTRCDERAGARITLRLAPGNSGSAQLWLDAQDVVVPSVTLRSTDSPDVRFSDTDTSLALCQLGWASIGCSMHNARISRDHIRIRIEIPMPVTDQPNKIVPHFRSRTGANRSRTIDDEVHES